MGKTEADNFQWYSVKGEEVTGPKKKTGNSKYS